jgi:maleylpyruvate isomerase
MQNLPTMERVRELGADPIAWSAYFNVRGLAALEAVAAETAGKFLVGDAPTLADVYLVPQVYSARRWSVDVSRYPTLLRAEAACAQLPAFQAAHPDAQSDATI